MPAQIIDGKAVASRIEAEVAAGIERLGFAPGLVVVRVGDDPASEIYVRNKAKKARELGLRGTELIFPATLSELELLAEIAHQLGQADHLGLQRMWRDSRRIRDGVA
ncbi:MAG: tetrahydrofolate dehydrogenase/cyclohydrolase catalytic domain-containing protein [Thermoanaerobaculia bacterium]